MTLELFDSATGSVRAFEPRVAGHVGIYVCGLTVQSEPHLGHMRSAVNFDVLRRWLQYSGNKVTFIRNVTDVDDKIFQSASDQDTQWFALAYSMRRELDRLLGLLNVLPSTYEPTATGHVPEALDLIERLVAGGHAYRATDGSSNVYFSVASWPAYGELSGNLVETLHAESEIPFPGKRDRRDFVLWKAKKPTEPDTASWSSEFGSGRPGWHIGCSAMATKYLGPEFDIHGGGIDLRFPHHENEQAQSRAVGDPFARYWMHNAWITTAGEKMSKSLRNSMVLPELLQHVRPIELRYYLLAHHYRSTVEFSLNAVMESAKALRRVEEFLRRTQSQSSGPTHEVPEDFAAALDSDLSTPAALAVLHKTVRRGQSLLERGPSEALDAAVAETSAMLELLGLHADDFVVPESDASAGHTVEILTKSLLHERTMARAAGDWARADTIRDLLQSAGVTVHDPRSGSL